VVDGQQRASWVRATSVGDALGQLGMGELIDNGACMSSAPGGQVPLEGMTLEIKTLKNVTVYDGGNESSELTTHAVTAQELLDELNLELGPKDEVDGGIEASLSDGAEVHITRTGVSVVNEKQPIEPPVEQVEDPDLDKGEEKVEDEGKPGEKIVTYRVTKRNNEEVNREELSTKVLTEPEPKVIRVGTKEPDTAPAVSDGGVWDRLAHCESTGNWSINTGNGYYGGLQFDKQTWDAYGGGQYAGYPHEASREQQIAIATKLRDDRGGYSAWPACAEKLGLPT
jgi:resuscitation-promoting factor RpfB